MLYKSKYFMGGGEYDLDIIVPAYNVESYINQCIDSVLAQTTRYFYRLIIVDDGSIDGTGNIIDKYAIYNNILIIHQKNKGFSGARNTGLEKLNSKYVMFLDSDDFLAEDSIEKLMDCAYQNEADIVEGGHQFTTVKGEIKRTFKHKSGSIDPLQDVKGYPWGKVIKSSYFNNLNFPEGYWYEDSVMRQILYPQIKKAYGINDIVYRRRLNPQGITNSGIKKTKCIDSLWITLSLHHDRQLFRLSNTNEYYEYLLRNMVLTYRRTELMSKQIKEAIFVVFRQFILELFNAHTTNQKRYKALEVALQNNNFRLYKIVCALI